MNLLNDPLFRLETSEGLKRASLPGLLAALGQDRVESLPGIQRHQADAFHVFLCSLATIILARNGEGEPVQPEDYWREGLRMLAGAAGDTAWALVGEDFNQPAFLQLPLPAAHHGKLKFLSDTPDGLDLSETPQPLQAAIDASLDQLFGSR